MCELLKEYCMSIMEIYKLLLTKTLIEYFSYSNNRINERIPAGIYSFLPTQLLIKNLSYVCFNFQSLELNIFNRSLFLFVIGNMTIRSIHYTYLQLYIIKYNYFCNLKKQQ